MKQLFLYILPLLVALVGCRDDYEEGGSSSPSKNGEVRVPFSVSMPAQLPKTYALDDNDENEVKNIDILAFKVNGGVETFAYRSQAEQGSIIDDGVNNKKKFIITLFKDGSQTYRFVAIANAKEELDNTFPGGIVVGTAKDVVMAQLQLKGINKWNTDSGSQDYLPIPMWGETSNNIVIQDNTTITDLKLLRMVGKINIKVDPSITEDSFALASVSLYNYYSDGRIAPDQANLVSGSTSSVDKPTVTGTTVKGPIDYDGSNIITNNSIINNIYTFESAVPKTGSEVDMSKVTTLVIGGKYNGATAISYYRVDIANGKNYLDILRNHLYTINITKVKSSGYATKEEAFNSRPINIEAEVVVWDDANLGNIEFDGQFLLAVSQGKFLFTKNIYTIDSDGNTVSITTDYKSNDGSVQGWKVASIVDANGNPITDWLKTSVEKGDANVTTKMQLLLTENNSGQERTGYIHISAGRLTYVIEVNQNVVPALSLTLKDKNNEDVSELMFVSQTAGVVPAAQEFTASWLPTSQECDLTSTPLGGIAFSFEVGSDTPGSSTSLKTSGNGTGKQTFTIIPKAFTQTEINTNPIIEKASKIDFTISNGFGFISKTIYLRQIRYGIQAVFSDSYLLNNTQQSVRIKSNSLWKIRSVTDTQSLLVSFDMYQNGGYNITDGDPLVFTLRKPVTESDFSSEIIFTLYDPSGKYADVDVKVDPLACGIDGLAAPLKIGNGTYLTHMYGDKCWMVENLKEGTAISYYFGGPVSGNSSTKISGSYSPSSSNNEYYYSSGQASSICPTGWHLPTKDEANAMLTIVNANLGVSDKGAQWWAGSGIKGFQSNIANPTLTGAVYATNLATGAKYEWKFWSIESYWWINTLEIMRSDGSRVTNYGSGIAKEAYYQVRCVQD